MTCRYEPSLHTKAPPGLCQFELRYNESGDNKVTSDSIFPPYIRATDSRPVSSEALHHRLAAAATAQ